jgi:hypothetical protein
VAYATEVILRVLIIAGTGALALSVPVSIAIAAVIAIVINSYRQTILNYPQGASDYIVAKDNPAPGPGWWRGRGETSSPGAGFVQTRASRSGGFSRKQGGNIRVDEM